MKPRVGGRRAVSGKPIVAGRRTVARARNAAEERKTVGKKLVAGLAMALLLGGCATPGEQFKRYAGQDVREVMLDYGKPDNAFDMPDGQRAFQWVINRSYTTPTQVVTTRTPRSRENPDDWVSSNTTIFGGELVESTCLYTLLASWDEGRQRWLVSRERSPRVSCQ